MNYKLIDVKEEIVKQLKLQLNNFFVSVNFYYIVSCVDEAYQQCMESISKLNDKHLKNNEGLSEFSIYHSGCWAVYLYYLSNLLGEYGGGGIVCRAGILS